MAERAPPKGFGAYLVQLARTILFPLLWIQALRIAREKQDADPRGTLKVGGAIVASLLLAGGLALFLWDFHEDAERAMYDGMSTRIARAAHEAGPDSYQSATEAVSAGLNMMSSAASRLEDLAGAEDAAARAAAQRAAAEATVGNATELGIDEGQLADAEGAVARADAAGLSPDEIQAAAAVMAGSGFPEESRAEANATLALAREANLTADGLRAALDVVARAQARNLTAANLTAAQGILSLGTDTGAAVERARAAYADYNATIRPLLGDDGASARLEGRDVAATVQSLRADVGRLEALLATMNESLQAVDGATATRWGTVHAAAAAGVREGLDQAEAFADNHVLALEVAPAIARQDDAAARAGLDQAEADGTDFDVAAAQEAFRLKDDAKQDMDSIFLWVLWPSVVGVFFAPLVFALGSVLRSDWMPSDTVGLKPYPGKAGGWFLLLGGFGVPALFFAAWMFKDMQARAIERQIAL